MNVKASPVEPERILPFRDLYKQELNCQIVHNTAHDRKDCVQSFLLEAAGEIAGYGSTWVGPYWMTKGSAFEFYVLPSHRGALLGLFQEFIQRTQPPKIYAQTNDPFLGILIYDYVEKIVAAHILYEDWKRTTHAAEGVIFRRAEPQEKDNIFEHKVEPVGDWLLEKEDRVIATGGVAYHYNRPYGDIFMEVQEQFRRCGYGQFLVQELKKVCYQAGSRPAARTGPINIASQRTLAAAGFAPCARLIYGDTALANQK